MSSILDEFAEAAEAATAIAALGSAVAPLVVRGLGLVAASGDERAELLVFMVNRELRKKSRSREALESLDK